MYLKAEVAITDLFNKYCEEAATERRKLYENPSMSSKEKFVLSQIKDNVTSNSGELAIYLNTPVVYTYILKYWKVKSYENSSNFLYRITEMSTLHWQK